MIILSAHTDKVRNESELSFVNGVHRGLLDNFLGVLATYLAIYDTKALRELCKSGKVLIHHSLGEEFGVSNFPVVHKEDVVIVIDVTHSENHPDFTIENFYNWGDGDIKDFREFLDSEQLNYDFLAKAKDDDESIDWSKLGCRVFCFGIPIEGNYHSDTSFDVDSLVRIREALKRVICYFV